MKNSQALNATNKVLKDINDPKGREISYRFAHGVMEEDVLEPDDYVEFDWEEERRKAHQAKKERQHEAFLKKLEEQILDGFKSFADHVKSKYNLDIPARRGGKSFAVNVDKNLILSKEDDAAFFLENGAAHPATVRIGVDPATVTSEELTKSYEKFKDRFINPPVLRPNTVYEAPISDISEESHVPKAYYKDGRRLKVGDKFTCGGESLTVVDPYYDETDNGYGVILVKDEQGLVDEYVID